MELNNFLNGQRKEYLQAIEYTLQKFRDQGEYEVFLEPINRVKIDNEKGIEQFSFIRYDILVKAKNGGNHEVKVNIKPALYSNPLKFDEIGIELLIESFAWNACAVIFSNIEFNANMVSSWYLKWIKPNQNEFGKIFQEAIHSAAYALVENKNMISIDFGSVPLEAVFEFFSILAASGVKELTIKSLYE